MSKNMKELLLITKNMQKVKNMKMDISDKISAQQIKRQYEEYQHQVNQLNDAFKSKMHPEKKIQHAEDALKRSHYLLKKSMQAAMNFKGISLIVISKLRIC